MVRVTPGQTSAIGSLRPIRLNCLLGSSANLGPQKNATDRSQDEHPVLAGRSYTPRESLSELDLQLLNATIKRTQADI